MAVAKRIFLFLVINFLVVITISFVLSFFNIQPFLASYGINYQDLAVFCLIWGMGGSLISLAMSRVMAKWLMGVKLIDPNTNDPNLRELLNKVYSLARDAHLPDMPQVGVYDSQEVNAFATGPTKRRALVAVSKGLLDRMSSKEIEGVLAHELTHITNGDMVTMTLIQGIVNAFVMFLARVLAFIISGLGKNREESQSSGSYTTFYILTMVFEVVFLLLGSLVIAAFARWREFRADHGGALLAGKEKMIAALESLQKLQRIKDPAAVKASSFQAFKISTEGRSRMLSLFSTHPPLEERIARLRLL